MDEKVTNWLESKSESTRVTYKSTFKKYLQHTEKSGKELVEEIDAEFTKKLTERGEIERTIKDYYKWMTVEKDEGGLGLSEKTGASSVGAVMSFYRYYNYRVNIKIGSEFKPTNKNAKVNLTVKDVRMLVNHAKNQRDRAIILVMAQSGLDVSTVSSLKIKDVWKGLQDNEVPLRLHLTRKKENVEFDTFLAKDAIEAVRSYLRSREANEGQLEEDTPLFIKEGRAKGKKTAIQPNLIQKFFREIAPETPLTSKEHIKENHWNPVRPHAMRRFFSDRLSIAGANTNIINYMLGHKLPYGGAYFGEAYNYYKLAMDHLSIFEATEGVSELRDKMLDHSDKIISLMDKVEDLEGRNIELIQENKKLSDFMDTFGKRVMENLEKIEALEQQQEQAVRDYADAEIQERKDFKGLAEKEKRKTLKVVEKA